MIIPSNATLPQIESYIDDQLSGHGMKLKWSKAG